MFKLSFRITWPLVFMLLLAALAYLVRDSQQPARRSTPQSRPANSTRPPVIINMPSAQESRDYFDTAELDREVIEAVRAAQTESPFAEYARQFKRDGEKRRATRTTTSPQL